MHNPYFKGLTVYTIVTNVYTYYIMMNVHIMTWKYTK